MSLLQKWPSLDKFSATVIVINWHVTMSHVVSAARNQLWGHVTSGSKHWGQQQYRHKRKCGLHMCRGCTAVGAVFAWVLSPGRRVSAHHHWFASGLCEGEVGVNDLVPIPTAAPWPTPTHVVLLHVLLPISCNRKWHHHYRSRTHRTHQKVILMRRTSAHETMLRQVSQCHSVTVSVTLLAAPVLGYDTVFEFTKLQCSVETLTEISWHSLLNISNTIVVSHFCLCPNKDYNSWKWKQLWDEI